MPLSEAQELVLDAYHARVNEMIEKARKSRAMGKAAVADRQLEQCVEIWREYALSQTDVRFKVSYLCGTAVAFAVRMGMHIKANQVLKEAESLCPQDDAEMVAGVAKLRVIVDEARAKNYHPLKKAKRG